MTPFEARLLELLRGILRGQADRLEPLLGCGEQPPAGLTPDALALVEQTLALGLVESLARRGSWRPERFLRGGEPRTGRLWQRTEPHRLGLTFSTASLDFLVWLAAAPGDALRAGWQPGEQRELTSGDRLLLLLTYEVLRGSGITRSWTGRPVFARHALVWLAWPQDYAECGHAWRPDFEPWVSGEIADAWVLESLQPRLADQWLEVERAKSRVSSLEHLLRVGEAQRRVLDAFFAAVEQCQRRDLARFLLSAGRRLSAAGVTPVVDDEGSGLQGLPQRRRQQVVRAATAFWRGWRTLRRWRDGARAVGYFDEHYAAAQNWSGLWEHYDGNAVADYAERVIGRVERWERSASARGRRRDPPPPGESVR